MFVDARASNLVTGAWPPQAERFLYFENQYWLGGSGEWQSLETANICNHLVPIEIALKVSEKILAGEPFAAYCVIPLFPKVSSAPTLIHVPCAVLMYDGL